MLQSMILVNEIGMLEQCKKSHQTHISHTGKCALCSSLPEGSPENQIAGTTELLDDNKNDAVKGNLEPVDLFINRPRPKLVWQDAHQPVEGAKCESVMRHRHFGSSHVALVVLSLGERNGNPFPAMVPVSCFLPSPRN